MTSFFTSLFDYHLVDTPHSATLANASLSTVAGSGHTHLSPNIKLLFVLHVLGFPFNLLSISKITKAINFFVSFYPSLYIFQDLKTWRMIGIRHEVGGLYNLISHLCFSLVLCSRQPLLFSVIVVLVILPSYVETSSPEFSS
jgi:hypothetical protein